MKTKTCFLLNMCRHLHSAVSHSVLKLTYRWVQAYLLIYCGPGNWTRASWKQGKRPTTRLSSFCVRDMGVHGVWCLKECSRTPKGGKGVSVVVWTFSCCIQWLWVCPTITRRKLSSADSRSVPMSLWWIGKPLEATGFIALVARVPALKERAFLVLLRATRSFVPCRNLLQMVAVLAL